MIGRSGHARHHIGSDSDRRTPSEAENEAECAIDAAEAGGLDERTDRAGDYLENDQRHQQDRHETGGRGDGLIGDPLTCDIASGGLTGRSDGHRAEPRTDAQDFAHEPAHAREQAREGHDPQNS